MKKVLISVLVCFAVVLSASAKEVSITIKRTERAKWGYNQVTLQVNEVKKNINFDTDGVAEVTIDLDDNAFAYVSWNPSNMFWSTTDNTMLYSMFKRVAIYINPNENVEIKLDKDMTGNKITASYENDRINEYLINSQIEIDREKYNLNWKDFSKYIDGKLKAGLKILKKKKFPKEFAELQAENLRYQCALAIVFWKGRNTGEDELYNKRINELAVRKEKLLNLEPYRVFVMRVLKAKLPYDKNQSESDRLANSLQQIVDFDFGNYQDKIICEAALGYFNKGEITGSEKLQKIIKENVKNKEMSGKVFELIHIRSNLRKGAKSASFNLEDINGKMVSLDDLKGKYVYIDVWASWCGPCKGEIPALQQLEQQYHDKNIHFVSISIDQVKKAWKKSVEQMGLSGIQLHIGDDKVFTQAYRIQGIPRFILLDPNGCIVDKDAPRPSSNEIKTLFDKLLN